MSKLLTLSPGGRTNATQTTNEKSEVKKELSQKCRKSPNQLSHRTNEGRRPNVIPREKFKYIAKRLKRKTGCKSTQAHEALAKSLGYNSYNHYLSRLKAEEAKDTPQYHPIRGIL